MHLKIPYGNAMMDVSVPDENIGEVVYPNKVAIQDETDTLMHALNHPVRSPSFDAFLSDAKDILFIVNDATRPTPTAKVLRLIEPKIRDANVRFIIATGVHRAPTVDELEHIFGSCYGTYRDRILIHDAKDTPAMVSIGVSKNGTEMEVNRHAMAAHKIGIIGSVEPHYFAGYTGGRKAFLPGIASYKTIEQNHKLALNPAARALELDSNPVHQDMEDALQSIRDKEIFSIMTVLDREDRIYAAAAGDITESLKMAARKSREVFSVRIRQKYDVVVAVAPCPMDVDLYQSQKALDNAKHALNRDGILILVSKCRSGIGHQTFVDLLSRADDPRDALNQIDRQYILGYHKAAKMAEIADTANIWAVTDIDPKIIRSIFMRPFGTVQEALDEAIRIKGKSPVLFMMAASVTIPGL